MLPCDAQNRIHLARDARVVNDDNRASARGDQSFKKTLVHIQRVGPDIDEHGPRSAQRKRVYGGDKGE